MPDSKHALPRRRGRHYLGKCWEIADKRIQHYKDALDATLTGDGNANPLICRDMLDKWLDYRANHGPDDEAWL